MSARHRRGHLPLQPTVPDGCQQPGGVRPSQAARRRGSAGVGPGKGDGPQVCHITRCGWIPSQIRKGAQAELLARTYHSSIVSGIEPRTFWHNFRNDGGDSVYLEHNRGKDPLFVNAQVSTSIIARVLQWSTRPGHRGGFHRVIWKAAVQTAGQGAVQCGFRVPPLSWVLSARGGRAPGRHALRWGNRTASQIPAAGSLRPSPWAHREPASGEGRASSHGSQGAGRGLA
jgi:hypothetical protein